MCYVEVMFISHNVLVPELYILHPFSSNTSERFFKHIVTFYKCVCVCTVFAAFLAK